MESVIFNTVFLWVFCVLVVAVIAVAVFIVFMDIKYYLDGNDDTDLPDIWKDDHEL